MASIEEILENSYISIMAGGVGSRFWPSSTTNKPKQFLDILGIGKSLLRLTFERFNKIIPSERIFIVTNEIYRDLVMKDLPELAPENILCEPSRNNTGPCVAYTALKLQSINKEALFVTAPSDHVILKEEEFLDKIKSALTYISENNAIVTLGIQPTRPNTGYGYIEVAPENKTDDLIKVTQFKEKPDAVTAQQYLDAGNYFWNAGIFIWKAGDLIKSFQKNAPQIVEILGSDLSKFGTTEEQAFINEVYPSTPSISVDYAILEKAENVFTIPADIGWSDLGTWNSLHEYMDKDQNQTATIGSNTFLMDTSNCIIRSDSEKIVVIKGLSNYIVVDEADALLIYPKEDEQEIKQVVKQIGIL
ncbi:MAG: mannose-1-phosphate guanylyltransferase [Saprospiraceae bacterium]|nr:mannose-1-phosphate guanylyltransferase [Saprospiraceae bacterium]